MGMYASYLFFLTYLPWVFRGIKKFSAHFFLPRIFLSTGAVLIFHEHGETIGGGAFSHFLEHYL